MSDSGVSSRGGPAGDATAETDEPPAEARRMRRAIREIRREGWKVAVVYAVVDAALATLLSNLVLTVLEPASLPRYVPLPEAVLAALAGYPSLASPTIPTAAAVGVVVGLVVFALEVGLRVRRPLLEQFEAANDDLHESLRTARDAVEDGVPSRMALRLYDEVLADLQSASSVGLVDLRRVGATVLLVVAVSVATIHLATVDVTLLGGPGDGPPAGEGEDDPYGGLQDPSSVLGEPEDVPVGQENLDAVVDTGGSGGEAGEGDDPPAAYEDSGFVGSEPVESQRAAFGERERLEDAELIREYNVRIREDEDR